MSIVWANNYKGLGYTIRVAAYQPSKARRGGTIRNVQILKGSRIIKNIPWKVTDMYGCNKAFRKAEAWIDELEAKKEPKQ